MKVVFDLISREIRNQQSRFVFPSETAASLWARKACLFTGERSLALNRFLAWDRFKETAIRSNLQDRGPVSAVLRKLFTGSLIRKNAQGAVTASIPHPGGSARPLRGLERGGGVTDLAVRGEHSETAPPFFRVLIPPEFAGEGAIFVREIAALLPSLALWKSRLGEGPGDEEDRDFALLAAEYGAFLEGHGLFEPAWEKPPLGDRDHEYYIFFPGALEDWEEYRELLSAEPSIHVVDLEDGGDEGGLELYYSEGAEIQGTAREIRRLHEEEGLPYEDMALSVPDLGEAEAYILRDFALYDIPVRRRAGRPLADYGAGKLFALIALCVGNNFSFASLKALLLNDRIPWRRPDLNRALIEFGAANNCVSGYREGGRTVDIWAEALRGAGREEVLRNYYGELRDRLTALTEARSFAELRRRYFAFRGRLWGEDAGGESPAGEEGRLRAAYPEAAHLRSVFRGFLSREACSAEADAVLARCVEELSTLIRLEEEYPDLVPPSPFNFFLEELREIRYVPLSSGMGVNVFQYRVAAAAPFGAHFVLGASQQGATVLYQPLRFLRQDKRKRLGLTDSDASAVFFRLYRPGSFETAGGTFVSRTRISASERTFSGWAIPHSFFAGNSTRAAGGEGDLYGEERLWWAGKTEAAFPRRLFRAQREGFDRWHTALRLGGKGGFNYFKTPYPGPALVAVPGRALLEDRLRAVQYAPIPEAEDGAGAEDRPLLKVSATDLNGFFGCPASWLWGKVFALEDQTLEARLLDDASLGLLYHEILKNLFTRIGETDRIFKAEELDKYRRWAEECSAEAAGTYPAFQGPLAVPLLVSMSRTIAKKIQGLLDLEGRYFPGHTVSELEASLELRRGNLLFKGRLDRVSLSPEDEPCIMDYKTGKPPTKAASTAADDGALGDFQIPLYVKLYEEIHQVKTGGAFFVSINGRDLSAIIGSPGAKRGHSREDYQPTLDALETYIEDFAAALGSLNFAPRKIPFETCTGCPYRGICRTIYSLNAETERRLPPQEPEAPHAE